MLRVEASRRVCAVQVHGSKFQELFNERRLCCPKMFSLPPPVLPQGPPREGDRLSQRPDGAAQPGQQQHTSSSMPAAPPLSATLTEAVAWTVGVAEYDAYLRECDCAPDVYSKLAELPIAERLKIARSTFTTQPDHPQPWLIRCMERYWEQKGKRRAGPYNPKPSQPMASSGNGPQNPIIPGSQSAPAFDPTASSPASMPGREAVPTSPKHVMTPETSCRRSLWSSPGSSQSPPEWVSAMNNNLKDKSKVMELFFTNLDADRILQLSKLPVAMQLHIAVACMLNPSAWPSVNEFVARCVATLELLDTPADLVASPSVQPKTLQLVVITVGYGMGLGHMAVHAALQQVSKVPSAVNLNLAGAYSFETDSVAVEIEKKIASKLHWTIHVCGDASALPHFVRSNAPSWKGCKVLLMSRLPRSKPSQQAGVGHGHTSLHETGSRLVWALLQALQLLAAEDKSNVLHLADIPVFTNKEDETCINRLFGDAFQAPVDFYGGTSRPHHLRTNYALRGCSLKHLYNKVDLFQTVDGWRWTPCGMPLNAATAGVVMTSAPSGAVCTAATEALYDDTGLSLDMKNALAVQTMTHMATQEKRLMSVQMWLYMLGLKDTVAEKVLKETHPCHGIMLAVNGLPPPAGMSTAPACGTGRWCKQCEVSLKMLGKCSHVPLMTDILVGLLTAAREAWSNQDVRTFKDVPQDEPHECGPSCPYVTQRQ